MTETELIQKFKKLDKPENSWDSVLPEHIAIKCAIVAVELIINNNKTKEEWQELKRLLEQD